MFGTVSPAFASESEEGMALPDPSTIFSTLLCVFPPEVMESAIINSKAIMETGEMYTVTERSELNLDARVSGPITPFVMIGYYGIERTYGIPSIYFNENTFDILQSEDIELEPIQDALTGMYNYSSNVFF